MTHAKKAGAMPATRTTKRPLPPARRRAPWVPTSPEGSYRLPPGIRDRLSAALAGFKNRDAAFVLAVFLARYWSSPAKLLCAFPIDRRALAEHEALGLTEARVRGALVVLVEIGFLARYEPAVGKKYQRTESGLQRRAILHHFGEEYALAFTTANVRALAARGASAPARKPAPAPARKPAPPRPEPQQAPVARIAAPRPMVLLEVAQKQDSPERGVIMGEEEAASPLEVAIERLRRGIGL